MLQAHSLLWHYLWVAPNVLLLALALLLWRRQLHRQFPAFVVFAIAIPLEQLIVYAADICPSVSGPIFWRVFWAGLLLEALVKFTLIGEIFSRLVGRYESLASLGKRVIRGVGLALVIIATAAAAFAPIDNPRYSVISRAHILDQTIYLIECGLLLFIFGFVAYFQLSWSRVSFGIALGLGVSSCVHLATWAVMANGALLDRRYLLDFVNMATYHVCVLIWFYYLLLPEKAVIKPVIPPLEHNLEVWNRALERLLQQ